MGTTTNFSLPYPAASDTPNGPSQIQALAEAVDALLIDTDDAVALGDNLTVAGTLAVTGATTVGDLTASGEISTDDLTATGDLTIGSQVWSGAWTDYNANWNTEAGASPSIGNGTLTARYMRMGKTVHFLITLVAGSTTSFGNSTSGYWRFNLPVAPSYRTTATATCVDFNSGFRYTGAVDMQAVALNGIIRVNAPVDGSNGSVHYQSPMTWANGDAMFISGTYEVA